MKNKMQFHTRSAFYHLPICCGFCGQLVIPSEEALEESTINPCQHTLFIAHSEGYEFLSDRVQEQLKQKGYGIEIDGSLVMICYYKPREEESLDIDDMITELDFPDSLVVESVVGAPSGMSLLVGFAPLSGE
ncbi:hypothetical protein ICN46_00035 [Polynucleobacter sp. Latsch14-2]|jgi:hypothetical protein|uniref:hypothetical protein n=1 Tax=Polynucleobacter sp. Latsch14-2 TaxID=2576920 RepID=UPI001C0DBE86|nr:hypothetical protein [Polynucleobacter sp. Latsch14-2]MBU3613283.1 hypothetical protein [Polynucleobacter sp. Latsch14-2]